MDDEEFREWVAAQRTLVELYLTKHGIDNPSVGPWPAFEVAPHFAIWAVESKEVGGKIGWWAFSGDCPTDYVSEDGAFHPRNALSTLLENWRSYVPHLKQGQQPPSLHFGEAGELALLGDLLEKRARVLEEWLEDDDLLGRPLNPSALAGSLSA